MGVGSWLPIFLEFRKDGWPLCPSCGDDELHSHYFWDGLAPVPPLEVWVRAGMTCLRCGWEAEKFTPQPLRIPRKYSPPAL